MAIQIVNKGGKDFPMIYCDHCRQEIEKADQANAVWLSDPAKEEGCRFDVGHVHKDCDDPFQRSRQAPKGSQWHWQGLNHHLVMLLVNCGYDAEEGRRTKELLDGLGL
jgi:hypothetical protein